MAITIALIITAMIALATVELWLFWMLGEREDSGARAELRRREIAGHNAQAGRARRAGARHIFAQSRRHADRERTMRSDADAG